MYDDKCPEGQKGVVKALVWSAAAGTAGPKVFVADIDRIRFANNGMAISFAFVPEDQDVNTIPKPPSAANLAELGGIDSGAPPTGSTASSTVPAGSTETTVPGAAATTLPGAAATTVAPAAGTTRGG